MYSAPFPERVNEVSLRPESEHDDDFLLGLYASVRSAEMRLTGWTPEQQRLFLRWQFDLQRKHYRLHYLGAEFNVVTLDDVPIGRMYVLRHPEEILLMEISIEPRFRARGIGTRLIRNLQEDAQRSGAKVTLHVEPNNPAFRLYQKLGFSVAEQRGINLFLEWRPHVAH
jgi:ribosomal protein S18 acetylase RimI-like enzyme